MNEQLLLYLMILTPLILVALVFFTLGYWASERKWKGEMVERGHARFHFYDGKWYWNEDVPKASDPVIYRSKQLLKEKATAGEYLSVGDTRGAP